MNKLVIIGASGQGKVIADIALLNGYEDIVFLDDNTKITECAGFPVVGTSAEAENMNDDFIVGIGKAAIRQMFQEKLIAMGKHVVTLIHPSAIISRRVQIGTGTVVMPGAIINSDTVIGDGCIINTSSSVGHDCTIGNYVHVSAGANVAGTVTIGDAAWIGVGSCVSNNVKIAGGCLIGAGAAVVSHLRVQGTYIGVPAKRLKLD